MKDDRQTICDRCRQSVDISDVKYVTKNDKLNLLCSRCRAVFDKTPEKSLTIITRKEPPRDNIFFCTKCRYKFKFTPKSYVKTKCPSCGRTEYAIKYNTISTETLLKTIDIE